MEGKRLRVVDFRAILCEKDDAHTLWYVLGVIVQKRAERCRYQSLAFRVDTAKAKEKRVTSVVNRATLHLFFLSLISSLISC